MERTVRASRRSLIFLTAMALVFAIVGAAVPAGAESWVNVAGVACAAYNNWQADALERSHIRLLNPSTSTSNIWVVCSVPRTVANLTSAGTPPSGWINGYFGADAEVGASFPCGVREYNYNTTNVPNVPGPTVNAVTVNVQRPTTVPGVGEASFSFPSDNDSYQFSYYTITCNLPIGMGINSIDFRQR